MHGWLYNWFMLPHRIAAIRGRVPAGRPCILDVGCGNHSPRITKTYLPTCEYHGVDNRRWNRDSADDRALDRLFDIDLEIPGALDEVPDGAYDAVICSHVLEHLSDPCGVVVHLARKVKPGGVLYAETPSPRSLTLPRAANGWMGIRGSLNFHDDDSHKQLVDLGRVAAALEKDGFEARGPRRCLLWRRVMFLPLYVIATLVVKGFVPASVVWDVTGFAASVTATRRVSAASGGAGRGRL
jgi:SAM-dependent methyltransferase